MASANVQPSSVAGIKTSFLATLSRGQGPKVGFLAEYDALPGIGHACGHNLIGVASSAAAIALAKGFSNFSGTISVVGCPAEEGGGGKILLAKKGVFHKLDCAMMAHPDCKTEVIKKMLALIEIDIEFFGRASHAAAEPEKGISALNAAVFSYQEILKMSRILSRDSRVHGIFTHGGSKPNIIPPYAALKYYVRALDMDYARGTIQKIKDISLKEAKKIGAKVKFTLNPLSYEPFHPNYALANIFKRQLKLLNVKNEQSGETERIGSSDVGNVGGLVPTIHPSIKICDNAFCHTIDFAKAALKPRGFQGMIQAASALALTGYELFSNPGHLKKMKAEFLQRKRR
ncbi:MAG: amidohydrolase [Deltaproteobacteria bacterium]|nr:amidohydrolase [Deltaproteobacteria bacterium]